MNDGVKELLWMVGCTTVMIAMGLIALVGYLRVRASNKERPKSMSEV